MRRRCRVRTYHSPYKFCGLFINIDDAPGMALPHPERADGETAVTGIRSYPSIRLARCDGGLKNLMGDHGFSAFRSRHTAYMHRSPDGAWRSSHAPPSTAQRTI